MKHLLRSKPLAPVPHLPLVLTVAALWAAPFGVGIALILTSPLTDGILPTDGRLTLSILGYVLLFSPLISWVGWLAALPAIWTMIVKGWFGWLPAAALGLVAGAVAANLTGTDAAVPFGLAALLALRAVLPRVLPITA